MNVTFLDIFATWTFNRYLIRIKNSSWTLYFGTSLLGPGRLNFSDKFAPWTLNMIWTLNRNCRVYSTIICQNISGSSNILTMRHYHNITILHKISKTSPKFWFLRLNKNLKVLINKTHEIFSCTIKKTMKSFHMWS